MKAPLNLLLLFLVLVTYLGHGQESTTSQKDNEKRMYIGTYTKEEGHVNGKADGIYLMYQHPETGMLRHKGTVAELVNPSFVKESRDGKNLYAVSELGEKDGASGLLYSYTINADDSLEQIGKTATESFAPCHIALDATGAYIFVSNYLGGVVAVYKRDAQGAAVPFQVLKMEDAATSHPHSVNVASSNRQLYITDLGNDKIWIYEFDASTGEIAPHEQAFVALEKGAGPRHFTFSKDETFAYSVNELNSSVSVFDISPDGGLKEIQTISMLPEGFSGTNAAADIHLHPSGDFLYASNRGHNSIVTYKISKGKLELIGFTPTQGKAPRNFALDATGSFLYVANQDSDTVIGFRITENSGQLGEAFEVKEVMTPVCLEL